MPEGTDLAPQDSGITALLSGFYVLIGIVLIAMSLWLDPQRDIRVLMTVFEVQVFIALGFYLSAVFLQNHGSALIISVLLLFASLNTGTSIVFYSLLSLFAVLFLKKNLHMVSDNRKIFFFSGMLLFISVFLGLFVLGINEMQCDFLYEKKMMEIPVSPDILFHAGIVSMLRDCGQVSLGLHGCETDIVYHVFSHRILAAIGSLHDISSLSLYSHVFIITIVPLLFVAILACAEDAFPSINPSQFFMRMLFLCLLLGGLAMVRRLVSLYILDAYLTSQSYNVGLTFLLAGMGAWFSRNRHIRFLGMGIGILCASMAKISTGAVGACLYLFVMWRWRSLADWRHFLFAGAIVSVIGYFALGMTEGNSNVHGGGFDFVLFHHLDYYMHLPGNWTSAAYFVCGHFIFSWLAIFLCLLALRYNGIARPYTADSLLFFLGANAIGIGIGIVAASLFAVAGAAFFYFSNISMFLALPVIVALWGNTCCFKTCGREGYYRWPRRFAGGLFAGICLASAILYTVPKLGEAVIRLRSQSRQATVQSELGEYLERLREIGSQKDQKRYLVYIPKKETGFWQPEGMHPQFVGFYIPAITGAPAIFGLPGTADVDAMNLWGLGDYPRDVLVRGDALMVPGSVLMHESKRLGYDGYVVVERNQSTWHWVSGD